MQYLLLCIKKQFLMINLLFLLLLKFRFIAKTCIAYKQLITKILH